MVYIKNNYSIVDQYPVVCEKFIQFVVEDDFSQGRPACISHFILFFLFFHFINIALIGEEVGVMFVDDVTPYEVFIDFSNILIILFLIDSPTR